MTCKCRRFGCGARLAFFCFFVIGRLGSCSRLVSIADLHGDFGRAVEILTSAGLIDAETLSWIGGDATLVQTGDIADRGDYAKRIFELFFRISAQASKVGGSVINLIGNHELMNLQNDLRYVSAGDYQSFGGEEARAKAWGVNGWLGQEVRKFPAAVVRGNVLFAHAGVLPGLLDERGVDGLDADEAVCLASLGARTSLRGGKENRVADERKETLFGDEGPTWTRFFASEGYKVCTAVKEVLRLTRASRMVVGHTIQEGPDGYRVHPSCDGQVVLADTAISRAYGGEMAYIEHDGLGGAEVVYPALQLRQKLPTPSAALSSETAADFPPNQDLDLKHVYEHGTVS